MLHSFGGSSISNPYRSDIESGGEVRVFSNRKSTNSCNCCSVRNILLLVLIIISLASYAIHLAHDKTNAHIDSMKQRIRSMGFLTNRLERDKLLESGDADVTLKHRSEFLPNDVTGTGEENRKNLRSRSGSSDTSNHESHAATEHAANELKKDPFVIDMNEAARNSDASEPAADTANAVPAAIVTVTPVRQDAAPANALPESLLISKDSIDISNAAAVQRTISEEIASALGGRSAADHSLHKDNVEITSIQQANSIQSQNQKLNADGGAGAVAPPVDVNAVAAAGNVVAAPEVPKPPAGAVVAAEGVGAVAPPVDVNAMAAAGNVVAAPEVPKPPAGAVVAAEGVGAVVPPVQEQKLASSGGSIISKGVNVDEVKKVQQAEQRAKEEQAAAEAVRLAQASAIAAAQSGNSPKAPPTSFDLPVSIQRGVSTKSVNAESAVGENAVQKIDYCSGNVDPFAAVPVDRFHPPAKAPFEVALQWKNAVEAMKKKISHETIGADPLRELMKNEVQALQVLRFKLFCMYA